MFHSPNDATPLRTRISLSVGMFSGSRRSVYIVYVIESAAYGVICTSCLRQKPERARYERVRAFDTNNEFPLAFSAGSIHTKLKLCHN